jgi:uncharacterized repeat protein (TIGR03803 family)
MKTIARDFTTFAKRPQRKSTISQSFFPLFVATLCTCFPAMLQAQTNYQRLWAFDGFSGFPPSAPLIQGSDGKLYGTTAYGGTNGNGTVFRVNKDGSDYTILHNFSDPSSDGSYGEGLVQGADGALYGASAYGGTPVLSGPGYGTVYKINSDGSGYQVLHRFSTNSNDGAYPDLLSQFLGDGDLLYGTTYNGGSKNDGTIFSIHTDGSGFAIVHSFTGAAGLAAPQGGLIKATNGGLYGMANGGSNNNGAVFKINTNGTGFQVFHQFGAFNGDAYSPCLGLIQASDGRIYGVTDNGGAYDWGALFAMNQDGSGYSLVHSFTGPGGDGAHPSGVIEGVDGALYGVTADGGTFHAGAIFKLNKSGAGYTVLYSLTGAGGDGKEPSTALSLASDGSLSGTTYSGGFSDINRPTGYGTLFRLFSGTPKITITRLDFMPGGVRLSLAGGAVGQSYKLQVKTNLNSVNGWQTLGFATAAIDGAFQFMDTNASTQLTRFYRSSTP